MYVSVLLKYVFGVLLAQLVAGILVYGAMKTPEPELWLIFGALALTTAVLTGFWFGAIAGHRHKQALWKAREDFSRQRERIKVKAEKDKADLISNSHQQINKQKSRAQHMANLKLGAGFAALMGFGLLMLLTQFATFGLLTLTTAGGAVGGYLLRDRRARIVAGNGTAGRGITRFLPARRSKPAPDAPADADQGEQNTRSG